MIVTNQATDTKRNFKATSTSNRIVASTMSVDEYFDELIDKVREDYASLWGFPPLPKDDGEGQKEVAWPY